MTGMTAPRAASVARIGSRQYPDAIPCLHCREPVRTTNFALGPQVEHYDPDASFRDSVWRHCRQTIAALPDANGDPGASS